MLGVQGGGRRVTSPVLPAASECDLCRGVSSIIACPNCEPHLYVMTKAQTERLRLVLSRLRPFGHKEEVDK